MSQHIRVDVTRPLATVVLEPPAAAGAAESVHWRSLADAFQALNQRRDVAAVVVRGTMGRTSPPTGDQSTAEDGRSDVSREIDLALAAVRTCRHPTVAVIEGLCVGADLEIAACCDLRVCGESSRLGSPIGREGGAGSSFADLAPLTQLLGSSPALDALRGGDMMDAERARTFGLVSHVHPDTAVVEHAYRLAASVAAGAPLVNRWHKRVLQHLYERASSKEDAVS